MKVPAVLRTAGLAKPGMLSLLLVVSLVIVHPVQAQYVTKPLMQFGIGALYCASLTPDATQFATGGADGAVRFWSVSTGQLLRTIPCHDSCIYTLAFSRDGKRMLTGCRWGGAGLWDLASGRLLHTLSANRYNIVSVAFSPDGQTLLTTDIDTVYVWDAASGQLLRKIVLIPGGAKPSSESKWATASSKMFPTQPKLFSGSIITFSSDAKKVINDDYPNENAACLWDTTTGKRLCTFTGHTAPIDAIAISTDGTKVATGCGGDGTVRIWNATTGQPLKTMALPISMHLADIAFSPDGKRVAVVGSGPMDLGDYPILVWDAATGQQIKQWSEPQAPYGFSFSADSKSLLTYGLGEVIRLWDATSGQLLHTYTGHVGHIAGYMRPVALSSDGTRVLTGHMDGKARLWDAQSGRLLLALSGYSNFGQDVGFSIDGKALLTSDQRLARVSDAATGKTLRANTPTTPTLTYYYVKIAPDGKQMLAKKSLNDKDIVVVDLESGKVLRTITTLDTFIYNLEWSSNGKWIMAASYPSGSNNTYSLYLFDAQTGMCRGRYISQGVSNYITSADISADGKKLIMGSWNNVWVFNIGNPTPTLSWTGHDVIGAVALSPDGRRALIGFYGGLAAASLLMDTTNGKILLRLPHPNYVYGAMFSADGRRVLTGCFDGVARLWDISSSACGWRGYR